MSIRGDLTRLYQIVIVRQAANTLTISVIKYLRKILTKYTKRLYIEPINTGKERGKACGREVIRDVFILED